MVLSWFLFFAFLFDTAISSTVTATTQSHMSTATATPPSVRLAGGPSAREGRLEVYHDSSWGIVCSHEFTDAAARVVCYMLGYGRAGRVARGNFSHDGLQIWLDDVVCIGNESDIADCGHRPWGEYDCYRIEYVSVSCARGTTISSTVTAVTESPTDSSTEYRLSTSTSEVNTSQSASATLAIRSTMSLKTDVNSGSDTTVIVVSVVVVVGVVIIVLIIAVCVVYLRKPRVRVRHDTETDYQVPTTAHEHVNDRPYSSLSMDSRYPALPLQPLPQPPSPGEDDETYHTIDDYYQTAS